MIRNLLRKTEIPDIIQNYDYDSRSERRAFANVYRIIRFRTRFRAKACFRTDGAQCRKPLRRCERYAALCQRTQSERRIPQFLRVPQRFRFDAQFLNIPRDILRRFAAAEKA